MRIMKIKQVILLGMISYSSVTQAQVVIFDTHADPYSVLEYARDVVQTVQQVEHLIHDQKIDALNGLKYISHFQELTPLLDEIETRLNKGLSLTYEVENISEKFDELFKGFEPSGDYLADFEKWTTTTLDTLNATLDAASLQKEHIKSEQQFFKAIELYNSSASGRDQLLQTGNMITGYLTKETTKLRELLLGQLNAENVYRANELNMKAQEQAKTHEWLTGNATSEVPSHRGSSSEGFSAVPLP